MRTELSRIGPALAIALGGASVAVAQVGSRPWEEGFALVRSRTASEGEHLSSAYREIEGNLFVTAECASELLQDCLRLVTHALEERRATLLGRALQELHAALLADPSSPRELSAAIEVALALLGDGAGSSDVAAERAAAIRSGHVTWEHTREQGYIAVDWRRNSPRGLDHATPSLRRLWWATRYLELFSVRADEALSISALQIAFANRAELRDASRELEELHRCYRDLWGAPEEGTIWSTQGAGACWSRTPDETPLVSEALARTHGWLGDEGLWHLLLRVAIDVREPMVRPASLRVRVMDLLADWPRTREVAPFLAGVDRRLWSDLSWHARGALYLALRETDLLAISGPPSPAQVKVDAERVVVEPRPLLYDRILELLIALEWVIAKAKARGVEGLCAASRRIEEASRFVRLCSIWSVDARYGQRSAEHDAELLRRIREGLLEPRVRQADARLVVPGVGWMERRGYETVVVFGSDGRRYTGARTRIVSGR